MRSGDQLVPARSGDLSSAFLPGECLRADDDVEGLVRAPRQLSPFAMIARALKKRPFRLALRLRLRIDQDFRGQLPRILLADPIRQMQSAIRPGAILARTGDKVLQPLVDGAFQVELTDQAERYHPPDDRSAKAVAKLALGQAERRRLRSIVALRRRQPGPARDLVIKQLGLVAGVDAEGDRRQLDPCRRRKGPGAELVYQHEVGGHVARSWDDAMVDEPAAKARPPSPDAPDVAIALNVDEAGQRRRRIWNRSLPPGAPRRNETLIVGRIRRRVVWLAEILLAERLFLERIALRGNAAGENVAPTLHRRIGRPERIGWLPVAATALARIANPALKISAREMLRHRIEDGAGHVLAGIVRTGRYPDAVRQHALALDLVDELAALDAIEGDAMARRLRRRLHVLPAQRLPLAAMRAGDVEAPPVAIFEHRRDAADASHAGCRRGEFLGEVAIGFLPRPGLIDRRTAAIGVQRIFRHLVHDEVTNRDHLQPFRAACGHDLGESA